MVVPLIKMGKTKDKNYIHTLARAKINHVPHAFVKMYLVIQLILLSITMKQAM